MFSGGFGKEGFGDITSLTGPSTHTSTGVVLGTETVNARSTRGTEVSVTPFTRETEEALADTVVITVTSVAVLSTFIGERAVGTGPTLVASTFIISISYTVTILTGAFPGTDTTLGTVLDSRDEA